MDNTKRSHLRKILLSAGSILTLGSAACPRAIDICGSRGGRWAGLRRHRKLLVFTFTVALLWWVTIVMAPQVVHAQDSKTEYQHVGVEQYLPVFLGQLNARLTHPLSWTSGQYTDFNIWKQKAHAKVRESLLLPPPPVPFDPVVIAVEDRGSYVAQKLVLNISGDSRVLGYLLVPKGKGPFPGALLLHDHGGKFDIGKEKVVKPFGESAERIGSSRKWVNENYGGRYFGDALARRGYLCFVTDALNWGDRGGAEHNGQAQLNTNLMHFGMSLAGLIAHEDLRAAKFLAAQPSVDTLRIAAVGLSMGSFRTWQVAALSNHITAGLAICWMTTISGQMVPGNNKTRSVSAATMIHPGLFWHLDYPDIASIACPKPMLFYNGLRDALFPVPTVEAAYAKMHAVWQSQDADDRLKTKLWDVPHEFNCEMQDEAFEWLDLQFQR